MEAETQPTVSSMEVTDVVVKEKKKREKRGKSVLIGNKQQVWDGVAEMTGGMLKKDDLMECPKTKKIISKKKHSSGLALMERAKKAKEDPSDPLHEKFVSFFEHQYKKKPKDISKPVDENASEAQSEKPKKQRKRRVKKEEKLQELKEEVKEVAPVPQD
jgi:hypothetical protein